jgi:hypothetical protein
MVVTIKCLDSANLVRVDEEGRLWGDLSPKHLTENPARLDHLFEVNQKGNGFALKSLNSNKYIDLDKSCHFKYTSPQGTSFYIEDEFLFVNQALKGYLGMISTGELIVLPTSNSATSPCRLAFAQKETNLARLGQEGSDEDSSDDSSVASNETSPPQTEPVHPDDGAKPKGKYGDLGQNKRITALSNGSRKKKI